MVGTVMFFTISSVIAMVIGFMAGVVITYEFIKKERKNNGR